MVRKKTVPKKLESESTVPPEQEESEKPDNSVDSVIANWAELQRVLNGETIEDIFEKGWRPVLRTKKRNGKQYMVLRIQGKDPATGKPIDTERGLGLHTSLRWSTLWSLYTENNQPQEEDAQTEFTQELPSVIPTEQSSISSIDPEAPEPPENIPTNQPPIGRSPVLTTKVARLTPIGPAVQINLGTLQWFNWVQNSKGYPGTLDDFINQSVELLFTVHYNKEIAVVDRMEERP
jgi:hypothetical protein